MQPDEVEANQQEIIKGILRTVETMILPSLATTEYFQKHPFAFSHAIDGVQPEDVLANVPRNFSDGFVTNLLFPYLALKEDLAAASSFVAQMTPIQSRDLWVHQGLGALVRQSHNRWIGQILETVGDSVDSFLENKEGETGRVGGGGVRSLNQVRLQVAQELFASTEYGSPYRLLFVKTSGLQMLLCNIHAQQQQKGVRATGHHQRDSAGDFLHQGLSVHKPPQKSQDNIMPIKDKAFFVMMIRKQLLRKFRAEVQMVAKPDHMIDDTKSNKYRPPLIPGLPIQDEVSDSDRLQWVDQAYYNELLKELDMEEDARIESSCILPGTGQEGYSCGHGESFLLPAVVVEEESPTTTTTTKKKKRKRTEPNAKTAGNKRNRRPRVG